MPAKFRCSGSAVYRTFTKPNCFALKWNYWPCRFPSDTGTRTARCISPMSSSIDKARIDVLPIFADGLWAFNEPRSHSGYNVVRAHLAGLGAYAGFFAQRGGVGRPCEFPADDFRPPGRLRRHRQHCFGMGRTGAAGDIGASARDRNLGTQSDAAVGSFEVGSRPSTT